MGEEYLSSFEEEARPAMDEEEGNGIRGGTVVGEVYELWAIARDVYLDLVLLEILIDRCLEARMDY